MAGIGDKLEVFKKILDTLPNSIYLKDIDGRYVWLNKASIKQLEYKHLITESIIGKTDFDIFPRPYAIEYAENDREVMETKGGICVEEEIRLPNGKRLTQLSFKEPLYDNSSIIGVLGYTVDITEIKMKEEEIRREKEQAEAANRAKTEFLENMRHDIRTPLVGITGFANIIAEEAKDPKLREYTDNLIASSNALQDLLNEILEIVKVGSRELPLLKKKFDLKNKLSDVIKLTKVRALQKNIQLIFDYDEKIPPFLIGDSKRIHRIVLELITNALNFTNKGFVKLSTRLEKESERRIVLRIEVEDTGIGIPPEKREEVFLHFKRLTPSYEGIYKGAGLGLSIVKQFIEELDGEIYVESREGGGTRFIVILPLKKPLLENELGIEEEISRLPREEPVVRVASSVDIEDGQLEKIKGKSRILLVEDQALAAKVVMNVLSQLGCKVDHAKDGEQAIQLFQEKSYHLVFMDVGLPDMDGYEVTRRMRLFELNKDSHVPIIALTAHVDEENKQHCIDIGMNAVLSKPLTKEKANDILNAFIPCREQVPQTQGEGEKEPLLGEAINSRKLNELYSENQEAIQEILQLVIDSYPEDLKKIKTAYDNKDWEAVYFVVHKLKGGANYYAADRLINSCSQLENAIKGNEEAKINEFYAKLLSEWEAILKEVERMKDSK